MTTYRELVNMVLDEIKQSSDDSFYQEEHVIFLADHYRAFILKQRYSDIKKEIPESNYQTICVDLTQVDAINGNPCNNSDYLKSVQEVPNMMRVGKRRITPIDYFQGNFTYVNNERFKYAGSGSYLKNQIYGTIAPDNHLYMKSNNPQMYYLEKVKITGIFENASKAAELQCPDDNGNKPCDILDTNYPLEEALIAPVTELIVKELLGAAYRPVDPKNDATDNMSDMASYLRQNMKSDFAKQIS